MNTNGQATHSTQPLEAPPSVLYNWPAEPDVFKLTPGEQLGEVLEQVEWLEEALVDEDVLASNLEDLVTELHHRLEGFWRALAVRNGQQYVDAIFERRTAMLKAGGIV